MTQITQNEFAFYESHDYYSSFMFVGQTIDTTWTT